MQLSAMQMKHACGLSKLSGDTKYSNLYKQLFQMGPHSSILLGSPLHLFGESTKLQTRRRPHTD